MDDAAGGQAHQGVPGSRPKGGLVSWREDVGGEESCGVATSCFRQ